MFSQTQTQDNNKDFVYTSSHAKLKKFPIRTVSFPLS